MTNSNRVDLRRVHLRVPDLQIYIDSEIFISALRPPAHYKQDFLANARASDKLQILNVKIGYQDSSLINGRQMTWPTDPSETAVML